MLAICMYIRDIIDGSLGKQGFHIHVHIVIYSLAKIYLTVAVIVVTFKNSETVLDLYLQSSFDNMYEQLFFSNNPSKRLFHFTFTIKMFLK